MEGFDGSLVEVPSGYALLVGPEDTADVEAISVTNVVLVFDTGTVVLVIAVASIDEDHDCVGLAVDFTYEDVDADVLSVNAVESVSEIIGVLDVPMGIMAVVFVVFTIFTLLLVMIADSFDVCSAVEAIIGDATVVTVAIT